MKSPRERVRIGWFRGVVGAVVAAALGVVMGFASLALLWWNEARPNPAHLAAVSVPVAPDAVDPKNEGAFVSVTAPVRAREPLSDAQYLRPGGYLRIDRGAEMFAWVETRIDRGNRGPAYSYSLAWTAHPQDSARFHDPAGHENPPMRVRPARFTQPEARVGAFAFAPLRAVLPAGEDLPITSEHLAPDVPGAPDAARAEQGYLYVGRGSLAAPVVGDTRARYSVVELDRVATIFGDQRGASVSVHVEERGQIYHLVRGERDEALRRMDAEHALTRWLLRVAGFLFVYLALNLALSPVSAMLDILPPLATATRSFVALIALPLALGVSALTVVISAALHSALGLAILAGALVLLAVVLARRRHT